VPNISIGLDFAWRVATVETVHGRHEFIEPEHLFIGICKVANLTQVDDWRELELPKGRTEALKNEAEAVASLFGTFQLDHVGLYRVVRQRKGRGDFEHNERESISRSPASKSVFIRAAELAADSAAVTSLHLFAALLHDADGIVGTLLKEGNADVNALQTAALAISLPSPGIGDSNTKKHDLRPGKEDVLSRYGKDLTQLARDGEIQECIGRREEMLRIIRTLSRETKNSPLLVGEAGVGKTAIVEGLAWRIANDKDRAMSGKRIIQLQMADLVAGTKYRGQFEERLTEVLREATQAPDIILFIDEVHTVVGAGDGSGGLDAANIMKPALSRAELCCIGATTMAEYRKHIESDSALERRFQPIVINEPSVGEAEEILCTGYRRRLEEKHQIKIEAAALHQAVILSARYLPDRRLPDKAIDLLDEACARVTVPVLSVMPGEKPDVVGGLVTADTVAEVLSSWTGIPVSRLSHDDRERLVLMAEELKARIIGQDEACEKVTQVIQRARAGLKPSGRPIAVLLFVGPTGVGKTELAKATAAFLFGSDKAMVRIDLSEFMERHTVSRLIGAPPGYIGHDEQGQLTGALRRTPYCVVLLDEIEKAHPDVLNLFLQVFDDGRLTDSKGRTADATNALFIMTSNLGQQTGAGFGVQDQNTKAAELLSQVNATFRPEFINRLDDVIAFHSFRREQVRPIARLLLGDLERRLTEQDIDLEVSDAAVEWIVARGFDEKYGARHLRRVIEHQVENLIAGKMLRQEIRAAHLIVVDQQNGQLSFEILGKDTL
jgi:ATP-dependent Clp protease ATP-binding subunit ClpC